MRMSSVFAFGLPLILLLAVVGAQEEDCSGVSQSCNTASYQPNSPLQASLTAIITGLEQNTYTKGSLTDLGTSITYYNYISNTNEFPAAFGQGVCDISSISAPECTACLTSIANCISSACGPTVGAWAQANDNDCFMLRDVQVLQVNHVAECVVFQHKCCRMCGVS